jgi:hypothetical protein
MLKPIEDCKEHSVSGDPLFCQVTLAPEPMCVMASDQQVNDMKSFLTEQGNAVIMGWTPHFNLGPFLATIISYRHPMLDDCESGNNPVIIGLILLHVRRTVESYAYLDQVITSLCPELVNVRWIGTDREKAIFDGINISMPGARNIICTKHVRDNVERKLTEIGVGRKRKAAFCQDIFGGEDKEKGLTHVMDCRSFDEQLASLEKEWKDGELASGINHPPTFFDYFGHHVAEDMKESMIPPIRDMAGMEQGKVYYNNDNVSVNAKIEKFLQRKRNDWPSFVSAMRELTSMQSRNI